MSGLATFAFDTTVVDQAGDDNVAILGTIVEAHNVQVDGYPKWVTLNGHDFHFGVYFEVAGGHHWYSLNLFADKAEIEVYTVPTGEFYINNLKLLSIMRPTNQAELELALRSILADVAAMQAA